MSKADQLGAGRFGGATRPLSARRAAIGAATGVPTEGVAPPSELPVHRISLNPDNPRSNLGDLTELAGSLRDHGQKTAITVMSRDAFLKAMPEQEEHLEPGTTYVVVDGSTRLAAAREAGLATIKVMIDDEQGATAEELLESALVANIHRQDLEELDEARALERLLAIHGSQRKLAKRLHKSQGWVSQRLALLKLTPELKERIGQEPIELLRAVGSKPAEEQQAALDELKQQRAAAEEQRKAEAGPVGARTAPREEPTPAAQDSAAPQGAQTDYAVIKEAARPTKQQEPVPRQTASEAPPRDEGTAESRQRPGTLRDRGKFVDPVVIDAIPFDSPEAVLRILKEHMTPENLELLWKLGRSD
ncbi:ParB/RepB/Spo0J family partition protein [Streptomyces jeddahensis]|uniref:Chromosome-partitioning protein Spo0J n=1 Tax=Streptomyces jeddahensis TaxID=1716141 RepID=A0A177HIR4_9ACTN|nr:ParB/RepB/Spo0J family partition protein [Streptomyces jeddahensis]OAH10852.1 chromosome-partitioning protein Spo0J [Streptomyces jeddahensis]